MYYLCKFGDSWSVYDNNKNASRNLQKNEIEILKELFPGLISDNAKILIAIQVNSIQPNKLLSLQNGEKNGKIKKQAETPIRSS